MSVGTTHAPISKPLLRHRPARYPCTLPVDLVVTESNAPLSIPGRMLNLSTSGVAAAVTAELRPGSSVALEFRLPGASDLSPDDALRIRAVVCHHGFLRSGLRFVDLTRDQRDAIERWIASQTQQSTPQLQTLTAMEPVPPRRRFLQALWLLLAIGFLVSALGWWHWHQAWSELEGASTVQAQSFGSPTIVPGEDMERLLLYRTDPVYPNSAVSRDMARLVVLDAVIGTDGSVLDLRPISGAEELLPAAMDAAKLWRFQPYEVNGRPMRVETTVSVIFPEKTEPQRARKVVFHFAEPRY